MPVPEEENTDRIEQEIQQHQNDLLQMTEALQQFIEFGKHAVNVEDNSTKQ